MERGRTARRRTALIYCKNRNILHEHPITDYCCYRLPDGDRHSYHSRPWKKTRNAADYLVAGRQIHPFVMALSYGATFVSTSAIIGFGGAAAVFGMSLQWLTFLTVFVGVFIAFVFFGRRTRVMGLNLNAHTFPEFLGLRFDSTRLQGATGLLIFIAMPLYASVVLMGGAKFIAQILDTNYNVALFFLTIFVAVYVIMGGLKAVMYTDAFQGSMMFIGMVSLLVATYYKLGGFITAHQRLTDMQDLAIKIFGAKGHTGWTNFPQFGSEYWLVVVTTIVLGVGIGVLAQPQLIVRFMTVKSNRELNRAVLIGGIFVLIVVGVSLAIGALANVFFLLRKPGHRRTNRHRCRRKKCLGDHSVVHQRLHAAVVHRRLYDHPALRGHEYPEFPVSRHGRPPWDAIFMKKHWVVAATASSSPRSASCSPSSSAIFLPGRYRTFFEGGTAIIARGTAIFFGICAAAFLPMYFGALYFRNMTRLSAWACFVTGTLTSLFWLFFVHAKESKPLMICNALFGVDSLGDGNPCGPWSIHWLLLCRPQHWSRSCST